MSSIMNGFMFANELRNVGVDIPEDVTEIRIVLEHSKPATIVFCKNTLNKHMQKIRGDISVDISSEEFFNKLKDVVKLPEHTTRMTITANTSEIVNMEISAAFPKGSLEFLKTFEAEKAENEQKIAEGCKLLFGTNAK